MVDNMTIVGELWDLRRTSYGLKIFHMNIRSIGNSSNFNKLILLLHRIIVQFEVIVLSKCRLLKCPNLPTLPGFVTLVSDHSSRNDGVLVYFRHDMQFLIEKPIFLEANCLLLKYRNEIAVIVVHKSPANHNIQNFLNGLDFILWICLVVLFVNKTGESSKGSS